MPYKTDGMTMPGVVQQSHIIHPGWNAEAHYDYLEGECHPVEQLGDRSQGIAVVRAWLGAIKRKAAQPRKRDHAEQAEDQRVAEAIGSALRSAAASTNVHIARYRSNVYQGLRGALESAITIGWNVNGVQARRVTELMADNSESIAYNVKLMRDEEASR